MYLALIDNAKEFSKVFVPTYLFCKIFQNDIVIILILDLSFVYLDGKNEMWADVILLLLLTHGWAKQLRDD